MYAEFPGASIQELVDSIASNRNEMDGLRADLATLESKLELVAEAHQQQMERFRSEMVAQREQDKEAHQQQKELRQRNFAGLRDQLKTVMENYDPL